MKVSCLPTQSLITSWHWLNANVDHIVFTETLVATSSTPGVVYRQISNDYFKCVEVQRQYFVEHCGLESSSENIPMD